MQQIITVNFDAAPDARDVNIAAALTWARDMIPPGATRVPPPDLPAMVAGYRDAEARVLWQYTLVHGEWLWLGRVDISYEGATSGEARAMSRVNRFQEGHGPLKETWDAPTPKRKKPRVKPRPKKKAPR